MAYRPFRWHPHLAGAALVLTLLASGSASAQSAADKATARQLASDGIQKFRAGEAAEALELLQKAQALYQAPVHQLYIARSQAKLGQVVEAAETYRALARIVLDSDAPQAFREAKKSAAAELKSVEPRIASLTIDVEPSDAPELSVTIDGGTVNNAVLGVGRPSNPGTHEIVATALGYEEARSSVTLDEGGEASVRLELVPDANAGQEAAREPADAKTEEAEDGTAFVTGPMGLLAGVRIYGALPGGSLEAGTSMNEYFGPGVTGRFDLGFRFLHHFAAKLFINGGFLGAGGSEGALADYGRQTPENSDVINTATMGELGLALMATSDPRKFGAYGEIGVSLLRAYAWNQEVKAPEGVGADCENAASYLGGALHFGAGLNIPLHELFTLVPSVDFALGQLRRREADYGCRDQVPGVLPDGEAADLDEAIDYQLQFGIGGDFHFGDDWFR